MIDNFDQIKKLLKFENENEFYFIQVIQRKKEHEFLGKNNRLIKAYYIYSLENLEKYKSEMILLANTFNARVYIHFNRRNAKMIALEMMEDLAHSIKSNQFYLGKIYNTVCGRHHSDKDKTWIVDVDNKNVLFLAEIENFLRKIEPNLGDSKVLAYIETKNGYHIITNPFNSKKFSEEFKEIEIHKNNPTILYIP